MKAAVYHDRRDVRVEDVDEPAGPARRRGARRPAVVRDLRHRRPRVHRRPDRHAGRPAPVDRGDEPAGARPRVLRRGPRGRRRRHQRHGRRPGVGDAADLLRALPLLPARPAPPLRHDGVHRAEPPLGRPRRSGRRVGRAADAHPRRARRPAGRPRRTDRRVGTRRRSRRGRPGQLRARHRRRTDRHAQRRVRHRPRGDDGHRLRTEPRAPRRSPRPSASRRRSTRRLSTSSKPCAS